MKRVKIILSVALAAVLVFAGASAIFAKPEADAYESGVFNSANWYDKGHVTILTRANTDDGVLSTIEESSGYFLLDSYGKAADYNYFGILVCEPAADGYFKVIETDFTLLRPDGVKSDVVIPEGGFILGINGEVTELFADVKDNVEIGDFVKLTGVDIAELEMEESGIGKLEGASFQLFHDDGTVDEDPDPDTDPDTDPDPETPPTGDMTIAFVVAAIVALVGAVVVKKAKR